MDDQVVFVESLANVVVDYLSVLDPAARRSCVLRVYLAVVSECRNKTLQRGHSCTSRSLACNITCHRH